MVLALWLTTSLIEHSRMVVGKCLDIAANIRYPAPDISFLKEAAMLHDIGIFLTKAPDIGCHGDLDYICHGYLGRDLLEKKDGRYMPLSVKDMLGSV